MFILPDPGLLAGGAAPGPWPGQLLAAAVTADPLQMESVPYFDGIRSWTSVEKVVSALLHLWTRYSGYMATRLRGAVKLLAASIVSLAGAQLAVSQQNSMAGEPFPLGIADPTTSTAFIRASGRAVGQLDLKTGVVVRSWPVNGEPVGLYEGRVVIVERDLQANRLEASLLESGAEQAHHQIAITLPDAVDVRDPRFSYQAEVSGDALHLQWQVEGSYAGGAPAHPRVAQSYATSRTGGFAIDLRSGKVSAANAHAAEDRAVHVDDRRFPYQRRYPVWSTEPWRLNSTAAWLTSEPTGQNKAVFLNTESGGHSAKYALVTAHDPFVFLALDGSAVLALAFPPDLPQRASVFSVTKGEKIGEANFTPGLREFAAIGSRVYWLTAVSHGAQDDLQLSADHLASGKNLWRLDAGTVLNPLRQSRRP